MIYMGFIALIAIVGLTLFLALCFRVVVPTNAVHIVQSGGKTTSYGKDMGSNTYYRWPSWIPSIGVRVTILPLSVFRVELQNYSAYDKGRLPFILDVLAFFRISDPNKAAERISTLNELDDQLQGIMQGVVRTILAQSEIEEILGQRAKFSELFTKEVQDQLPQWGVEPVKSIELMDVRDADGGKVISNIMAKKKSEIEKESRVAVAANMQAASIAEVQAGKEVGLQQQEAEQQVGIRKALKDQEIGIAGQKATQAIKEQERATAEKNVAINMVNQVGEANIMKAAQIVMAEQNKEVLRVNAEGTKLKTVTEAEGALVATKLAAEGTEARGKAEGSAQTAVLMAPVTTQITLAEKIAALPEYQNYLVRIREIEANQSVGIEQAKALEKADVKVIATAGSPVSGIKSVMDLVGAEGGQRLNAMLETIRNSPTGSAILKNIEGGKAA